MTVELTILIIITSASLITSLVGPIITGIVEFSRRIEKSSCCYGSSIELTKINDLKQQLNTIKTEHKIEIDDLKKNVVSEVGSLENQVI